MFVSGGGAVSLIPSPPPHSPEEGGLQPSMLLEESLRMRIHGGWDWISKAIAEKWGQSPDETMPEVHFRMSQLHEPINLLRC